MSDLYTNWKNSIDQLSELVEEEFKQLSEEDLNKKSNPSAWSIAQCIEHLIITSKSYFPTFDTLIDTGNIQVPFLVKTPFLADLVGHLILKSVEPGRKKKINALNLWVPSSNPLPVSIVNDFILEQQKLVIYLELLIPFVKRKIIISSPANKNIAYSLKTAINIILTHQERHINQAKEVKLGILP